MPSPFPGMDPFIESQKWIDFHNTFITVVRESLMPSVRPKYIVDVDERVYVERDPDDPVMVMRPDVTVARKGDSSLGRGPSATVTIAPADCMIPLPESETEFSLTIRRKDNLDVVTVIELLSPTNKRPRADGFGEYVKGHLRCSAMELLRGRNCKAPP